MKKFIVFFFGLMTGLVLIGLNVSAVYAEECKVRSDSKYVDGCSGPWLPNMHMAGINIDLKKLFRPACNRHDQCYHSCGCTKEHCDNLFKGKMDNICDQNYPYKSITIMGHNVGDKNAVHRTACHTAAYGFYDAVKVGGKSSYDAAQRRAGCK